MISVLAALLAALVTHQLVDVTRIELGGGAWNLAPASLALGVAAGLLARARLPYLGACLGLVVLAFVRGPAVELAVSVQGGEGVLSLAVGAALLIMIGTLLGRQLASLSDGRPLLAVLGWALGEASLAVGAGSWLPSVGWTLSLSAILMASLVEAGRQRREARQNGAGEKVEWVALAPAWTIGLLLLALRRHVVGYAEPVALPTHQVTLAVLLPALLVGVFSAMMVANAPRARRGLLALGLLALGFAAWRTSAALVLFKFSDPYSSTTWSLRNMASQLPVPVAEWQVWLTVFAGWSAAAIGLVLGSLRARVVAPVMLGLAGAWLSQEWLLGEDGAAPWQLLAFGAGLSVLGLGVVWRPQALLAMPLALLAVNLFPGQYRDPILEIRRIGEREVAFAVRGTAADASLFVAGASDVNSPDGRERYRTTFTGDRTVFSWPLLEVEKPEPEPEEHEEPVQVETFGVRVAGVGLHEGAPPLGVEGSVGRWLRAFDVPGPALIVGQLAELQVAELVQLEPDRELIWSSEFPLELRMRWRLLAGVGFRPEIELPEPVKGLRSALSIAAERGVSLVLISPERAAWPQASRGLSVERLRNARGALASGGRCLAFVDTNDLDATGLSARLASFGAVFEERSLCLVVVRELGPPLLALVGWVDESGAPELDAVLERADSPDLTGRRPRLTSLADLGALNLADGPTLAELGDSARTHRVARPSEAAAFATGWAAIAGLELPANSSSGSVEAGLAHGSVLALAKAMAPFDASAYDVDAPGTAMTVQVREDVDWGEFEAQVERLASWLAEEPSHPAAPVILAAFLEPLALHEEYGRFAATWKRLSAGEFDGWRLPTAQAVVLRASLEDELAAEAEQRAREQARR